MRLKFQSTFSAVATNQIDNGITDFSLEPVPKALRQSIQAVSITHPLSLIPKDHRYSLVCGNRRLQVARELNLMKVPARILPENLTVEEQLYLNLEENYPQRIYSDLETGAILFNLAQRGVEEKRLIDQYMSILRLERSKKLALDYINVGKLPAGLVRQLHDLNAPLRTFIVLLRWEAESLAAVEGFIAALKPGVNKLRELLEWIDEITRREGVSPIHIIGRDDIQSILEDDEPLKRYARVHAILFPLRYPKLSTLRKEVWLALDQLKLDFKTKIRFDENFEKDNIRMELNFKTLEELQTQTEKLSQAVRSKAMREVIKVFKFFLDNS